MSINTNTLENQLTMLVGQYGRDAVVQAAEQLLAAAVKKIPAGYDSVVTADKIAFSVQAIDAAVSDVVAAGEVVDKAYGERASLLKQKTQLETAMQLTEANAIMQIRGESRSQYVMVEGEKVGLNNEEARKAYAKMASQIERKQLAEVEAQLNEIEVKIMQAKDNYATAKEGADLVKAKAHVQGNLLNFLA